MPYYPPTTGGGTGPSEPFDLPAALEEGVSAAGPNTSLSLASAESGRKSSILFNPTALAIMQTDDDGAPTSALQLDAFGGTSIMKNGGVTSISSGGSSGQVELTYPTESGTLALEGSAGATPTLQEVVTQGGELDGSSLITASSPDLNTATSFAASGTRSEVIAPDGRKISTGVNVSGVLWTEDEDGTSKSTYLHRGEGTGLVQVYLPSASGTLALDQDVKELADDVLTLDERLVVLEEAPKIVVSPLAMADPGVVTTNGVEVPNNGIMTYGLGIYDSGPLNLRLVASFEAPTDLSVGEFSVVSGSDLLSQALTTSTPGASYTFDLLAVTRLTLDDATTKVVTGFVSLNLYSGTNRTDSWEVTLAEAVTGVMMVDIVA